MNEIELLLAVIAAGVWGPAIVLALIWRLTIGVRRFNLSRRRKAMHKAVGRMK